MKILVVSDAHGRLDLLIKAYEIEHPDVVIFGGDGSKDLDELSYIYDNSKYYIVRGNCDYFDRSKMDKLEIELSGKLVFLTHGHLYRVKDNYWYIREEAKKRGAKICIFGHTHIPYLEEEEIILFNPGAIKDGVYGVIEVLRDEMKIKHKSLLK